MGRAASRFWPTSLARVFPDRRESDAGRAQPCRYVPAARMFRDLPGGYEDCRRPRSPAVRSGIQSWPAGRLPDSGRDLCSQPTLSRLGECFRDLRDVID